MNRVFSKTMRCDRRNFLQVGSATLFGLSFADLLAARADESTSQTETTAAQNCIFIWLAGGPATIDMWDMKPEAPLGIRGEFHPIATSVPGLSICEHLPLMAQTMDRCVLVRSVSHTLADHVPGTELVVTGHVPTPALVYPSIGSLASKLLPERTGVPKYMTLGDQIPGSSGFLGASGSAFQIRPADLGSRDRNGGTGAYCRRVFRWMIGCREKLLRQLDSQFAPLDHAPLADELSTFQHQALDILRSNKTRQALDLQAESEKTRMRYGNGWAGQALLAARRLVEAGVGFVTASIGGWDTHGDNFGQLRNTLLPQLDRRIVVIDPRPGRARSAQQHARVLRRRIRSDSVRQRTGRTRSLGQSHVGPFGRRPSPARPGLRSNRRTRHGTDFRPLLSGGYQRHYTQLAGRPIQCVADNARGPDPSPFSATARR